jgi:hypothetical protein
MQSVFYIFLKHSHSGLRWLFLAVLIASVFLSFYYLIRKQGLPVTGKRISDITVKIAHIQFLLGIILYFVSPKVVFSMESMKSPILRFYLVEHFAAMVIAIIFITIGFQRMKKVWPSPLSSKRIFWFYLVGLILVLALIPWPFLPYGGGWI